MAVSNIVSPNLDGFFNANADGINSTDVAFSSVFAKIFVVSLVGLSATSCLFSQENSNSRSEKKYKSEGLHIRCCLRSK